MRRRRLRLAVAGVFLLAAALLVPLPWSDWPSHVLVGWVVGVAAFCLPILRLVHRLDARGTAEHAADSEGGRTETDVVVILASVASLGAVGLMLARGAGGGSASLLQAALALLAVAASWVAVHTVYTLRYARHYLLTEPGCVDFDADGPPRLSDFAYLSFTLGMTYQVSDTSLRTSAVRLLVLRHTLLSYLFGTVVIATTINLVVGLAGSSGGSG